MKAITYERYGAADVMELKDLTLPQAKGGELLVKIHAASVNPVDWMIRNGLMMIMTGKKFPRGMGVDLAGVVEAVGSDVSSLAPGDEVMGWCPYKTANSFAEYAVVSEKTVVKKPTGTSFAQAACFPMAGATAYKALVLKAKLASGERVLVNGCTGGVGLFALQVAKAQGAIVTGTCSTKNVELAKQFGADEVIDYRNTNILEHDGRFDVILDASAKLQYKAASGVLASGGRFLDLTTTPIGMIKSLFSSQYFAIATSVDASDLETLVQMAEQGTLKAHITKQFSIAEALEALGEMEERRGIIGKAVMTMY